MKKMLSSYKTAIPGLLIVLTVGLFLAKKIDKDQLGVAVSTLTAAGLIAAKDGDKKEPR